MNTMHDIGLVQDIWEEYGRNAREKGPIAPCKNSTAVLLYDMPFVLWKTDV